MLKASHCIAIALAFLVAASLRASAGERPATHARHTVSAAPAAKTQPPAQRAVPWRLVFR